MFRTDVLPLPLPPNLTSEDSVLASDHLPVVLVFNYPDPALRVTLSGSQQTLTLNWPALVGREFQVEASTNFLAWHAVATNLVATNAIATWSTTNSTGAQFYRVVRQP